MYLILVYYFVKNFKWLQRQFCIVNNKKYNYECGHTCICVSCIIYA